MENQVNKLKLNVTNIKSYLIKSNKELKTIRIKKSNLLSNIGKQTQIKQKETKIESKSTSDNIFSRFVGTVTQPVNSIFDRILEFIGLIGLGILVQSLPKILKQIDDFFNSDFMKTVGFIFNSIGFGFQKLGELIDLLTPQKRNELDSDLKFIEKEVDENLKLADQSDKDIAELDKLLKEKEGNNQTETQSPQQPAQNTPSQSPTSPAQNTPSQSPTSPAQNTPSQSPTSTPPAQISQPEKPEKFSSGGTVRGGNTPQQSQSTARTSYQPKKSGQLKRAESGANQGFNQFSLSVNNIGESVDRDEKNIMAFAEMSKKFKEWSSLSGITTTSRPRGGNPLGPPPPGSSPDTQYPDQSFASGAWIGATGDTDKQQTGLNMNLPGGIGTPIYAPFDLIYKSRGTDGNDSVGLQGTPGVLGPNGVGFGYYGAYFFNKNGKEYEVLMGHFKSLPYKGAKDGEVIPKGTLLGYQGASGRSVSRTNGVYPHISLHVNGVGSRASNSILVDFAKGILNAKPAVVPTKPVSSATKPPPPSPLPPPDGGGGRRDISRLNRSSSGGNQSLFIYAVQPIETFVPYPYPVPMKSQSMASTPNPKSASVWRG